MPSSKDPIIFIVVMVVLYSLMPDDRCIIDFEDMGDYSPIFIKYKDTDLNEFELLLPNSKDSIVKIRFGKTIGIVCASKGNYDKFCERKSQVVNVQCSKEGWLWLDNSDKVEKTIDQSLTKFLDRPCNLKYPFPALRSTNRSCTYPLPFKTFPNGELFEVGFEYEFQKLGEKNDQKFIKIYDICQDSLNMYTLYSNYILTKYDNKADSYPDCTGSRCDHYNLKKYYDNQQLTLTKILGPRTTQNYIVKNQLYLEPSQLTPVHDLYIKPLRTAAYTYKNLIPQWSIFQSSNWRSVENLVRDLVERSDEPITIQTGVYDILKLPDDNGVMQSLYLDEEQKYVPVPKYFWKRISSRLFTNSIIIIGLNNPFALPEDIDELKSYCNYNDTCSTIVDSNSDIIEQFHDARLGYVVCCYESDVRNTILEYLLYLLYVVKIVLTYLFIIVIIYYYFTSTRSQWYKFLFKLTIITVCFAYLIDRIYDCYKLYNEHL